MAYLEHVNITVAAPDATAGMFVDLFGWHVRWSGNSIHNGYSVHVGSATSYVALYTGEKGSLHDAQQVSYNQRAGLNHIAFVVDDLDTVETKVKARGFEPHSHADYEPGRRFYFQDENGLEIEVVQYD
ncbi:Catechol 2,3-dioxygenase [Octadecabacter temperatus]|uniref:Glyoxalase-like domain protein n=1 Tax=Octadecabacter temperatus TaxID=1458307 RepID=A0A0K0Y5K9_9RHOB|nr:VOC family protein [Octadecabacter temperatus]AKS46176.1 Glyoxalase-like domain protein [Octadecabacter temperatus]SIO09032.1 Catechol 2,3-dioxygenase [Octadecabacter temperatus]